MHAKTLKNSRITGFLASSLTCGEWKQGRNRQEKSLPEPNCCRSQGHLGSSPSACTRQNAPTENEFATSCFLVIGQLSLHSCKRPWYNFHEPLIHSERGQAWFLYKHVQALLYMGIWASKACRTCFSSRAVLSLCCSGCVAVMAGRLLAVLLTW